MDEVGESFPDEMGAMRTYLRADPDLAAVIDGRVFFSFPKAGAAGNEALFPAVLITRIGGGQMGGEVPIDSILFQFDVLGKLADTSGGGYGPMTVAARALLTALSKLRGRTYLGDGVVAFDARIASQFDSPMPADNRPRRIVTAAIPMLLTTVP